MKKKTCLTASLPTGGYVTDGAAFMRKLKLGDILKEVKASVALNLPLIQEVKRGVLTLVAHDSHGLDLQKMTGLGRFRMLFGRGFMAGLRLLVFWFVDVFWKLEKMRQMRRLVKWPMSHVAFLLSFIPTCAHWHMHALLEARLEIHWPVHRNNSCVLHNEYICASSQVRQIICV